MLELADMVAVNKAEGENAARARSAAAEYRAALSILAPASPLWTPPVVTVSGLEGDGLEPLWDTILDHRARHEAKGLLAERRRRQDVTWMWAMIDERLRARLTHDPQTRAFLRRLETGVAAGEISATAAAEDVARSLGF